MAKAAAFSEHHFHRIFRATMDETVGQYITRTRLEAAALMLAYRRDLSVTRIGYACGYSSTSNFSKAFSAFFGVSPSAVRRQETDAPAKLGTLKQRYGKDFAVADLFVLPDAGPKVTDVAAMRFEQIPGFPVACMMGEAGYDVAATMRLWEELIARRATAGVVRRGRRRVGDRSRRSGDDRGRAVPISGMHPSRLGGPLPPRASLPG